jgi:hypothetical protein
MNERVGPFTSEHIEKPQCILDLNSFEDAAATAALIVGAFRVCKQVERRQTEVAEFSNAKKRLNAIFAKAADLAQLLSEELAAETLIRDPSGFLNEADEYGLVDRAKWRKDTKRRLDELISDLKIISLNAGKHANDNQLFRRARRLPLKQLKENTLNMLAAKMLWPILFEIWIEANHTVATTPNGPTHQFVKFVHSILGLEEPSASTMRDHITE